MVSCSFLLLLRQLLRNIFCLSSSMKLGLGEFSSGMFFCCADCADRQKFICIFYYLVVTLSSNILGKNPDPKAILTWLILLNCRKARWEGKWGLNRPLSIQQCLLRIQQNQPWWFALRSKSFSSVDTDEIKTMAAAWLLVLFVRHKNRQKHWVTF